MQKLKPFLPALFFLWAAFLLYPYFTLPADRFHLLLSAFTFTGGGPMDPHLFLRFGGVLFSGSVIIWIAWYLGSRFQGWLGVDIVDPWMKSSSGFSLGVLLISFLWFGLGLTGLWFKPLMVGILAILFLGSLRALPGLSRRFVIQGPPDRLLLWFLIVALIYLGFSLLHALLPETHPDGLVYHLGCLSYWLFHHGVTDFPSQPMAHFPFGGELFFLTGLLLQGSETAKFLNWSALVALALAAGGWAVESSGQGGKWVTFCLVLTLPLAHLVSWTTQVELLQSLFLLLFFYGLNRSLVAQNRKGAWVFLTGLLGGMALCVKYTSTFELAAGMIAFFFFSSEKGRSFVNRLVELLFIPFLVSGAWWLKNWVYAGDPVYPYLQDWFAGRRMSPAGFLVMFQDQRFYLSSGWNWWDFPYRLFIAKPSLFGFAGPIPLILAPLAFLFMPLRRTQRFLGTVLLILWPLGLWITVVMKFHLPILILTILFLGTLLKKEGKEWAARVGGVGLLSALTCFPFVAGMSGIYYSGGGIWSGREFRSDYLSRVVTNSYEHLCSFADNLPGDAKLLIVGDARGFGYPRDFYTDTGFDLPFLSNLFGKNLDLKQSLREIRKMGFTHIVVNGPQGIFANSRFSAYPLNPTQWKSLDDYFRSGLDLVYSNGLQAIFKVRKDLKAKADREMIDPVLFFSEPAVQYIFARQNNDDAKAWHYLEETKRLYPFSDYWKTRTNRGDAP